MFTRDSLRHLNLNRMSPISTTLEQESLGTAQATKLLRHLACTLAASAYPGSHSAHAPLTCAGRGRGALDLHTGPPRKKRALGALYKYSRTQVGGNLAKSKPGAWRNACKDG